MLADESMHTQTHFWETMVSVWWIQTPTHNDRNVQSSLLPSSPPSTARLYSFIFKFCFWEPLVWKVLEAFREPEGLEIRPARGCEKAAATRGVQTPEEVLSETHGPTAQRDLVLFHPGVLPELLSITGWLRIRKHFKNTNISENVRGLLMIYMSCGCIWLNCLSASD